VTGTSFVPSGEPRVTPRAKSFLDDKLIKDAAKAIDALIDAGLARDQIKPQPRTKDPQFLRRVYLDLAGRIPTIDETLEFLASTKADKRNALVRRLLESEAYVSTTFNWWADMLRARTRLQDRYDGRPYIDWIKQSIRSNTPYDRLVYQLITASGPTCARGNGATGFYVTDAGMPLDNMANTVRLFLGTRVACAQCHDHPFDKWTRKDFYQMAAFTAGTEVAAPLGLLDGAVKTLAEHSATRPVSTGWGKWGSFQPVPYTAAQVTQLVEETIGMHVSSGDLGEIALPSNYQYNDAKPDDLVQARTIFDEQILTDASKRARAVYGRWLTAPGNPRFTMVAVNRLWKRLMRVGLIEPLDQLTDQTRPFNAALADYLVQLLKDVHYDTRLFQAAICATNAYQAQTVMGDADRLQFHHEGQPLRRLSAEQMWDSLMTLTVAEVDGIRDASAEALYRFYEVNRAKSPDQLAPLVLKVADAQVELDNVEKDIVFRREKLAAASDTDKPALETEIKEVVAKRELLRTQADILSPYADAHASTSPYRRASELLSPTPPGHFLRVFGQSNRQLMDNASDAMNLTQALELMNGLVETTILGDPSSVLSRGLARMHAAEDKVFILYAAILSRAPTAAEMEYGLKVMSLAPNRRGAAYLGWALINSAEFAFNQ